MSRDADNGTVNTTITDALDLCFGTAGAAAAITTGAGLLFAMPYLTLAALPVLGLVVCWFTLCRVQPADNSNTTSPPHGRGVSIPYGATGSAFDC